MAKAPKTDVPAEEAKAPKETRSELNDRARFDYGILNAEDMSAKEVKDNIAVIDKQASDARKADEKAAKEAEKNA